MITKNVGGADRVVRIIAGLALLGFALAGQAGEGLVTVIVGAAGGAALLTGLVGWCGLYKLLGINTCKVDKP
ncbi:MAG TPA: DUF2892 domain-containing protein [Elusimicrobiales bacterium]|nr:DUF2892 domain-containing protein [Elusimicrobiales bacterium]